MNAWFAVQRSRGTERVSGPDSASIMAETTNTTCTPTSQPIFWASNATSMFMNAFKTWIAEYNDRGEQLSVSGRRKRDSSSSPASWTAAGIDLLIRILNGKHHDQGPDCLVSDTSISGQYAEDDIRFLVLCGRRTSRESCRNSSISTARLTRPK